MKRRRTFLSAALLAAAFLRATFLPTALLSAALLFGITNPLFAQTPDTTDTVRFVISGGETLYSLAARLKLTADSLAMLNPALPAWLRAGDVVRVPADRAVRRIIVQPGETLFAISRSYNVSVNKIRKANNMSGSNIRSGQTLVIPGQGMFLDATVVADGLAAINTPDLEIIESGVAVVYPGTYIGRMTASGRAYRPDQFVISHPDLGTGSIVLVSLPETGMETFAEIVDRGFRGDPQIIDVSEAVARHLRLREAADKIIEIRAVELIRN